MQHQLDITAEHCPMTFVKVKLALARIQSGDTLEVLLHGEEPRLNVPRTAREEGHEVLKEEPQGENTRVLIKKH